MGVQVSFGFGNYRLTLRAPEAHTTGGGTDEGQITEAQERPVIMSDSDPDIEVLETEVPPPPVGAPPRFRELVALALKTTDTTILDDAEQDFRGVFDDVDDFIQSQLGEYLPPHLQWLPACCDPEKLRAGYERGIIRLWTIKLADGRAMIFESQLGDGRRQAQR